MNVQSSSTISTMGTSSTGASPQEITTVDYQINTNNICHQPRNSQESKVQLSIFAPIKSYHFIQYRFLWLTDCVCMFLFHLRTNPACVENDLLIQLSVGLQRWSVVNSCDRSTLWFISSALVLWVWTIVFDCYVTVCIRRAHIPCLLTYASLVLLQHNIHGMLKEWHVDIIDIIAVAQHGCSMVGFSLP